jgi:hypothetical protein
MELELDRIEPRTRTERGEAARSPSPRPGATGMTRSRPEPSRRLIPLQRAFFLAWALLTILWAALLAGVLALTAADNGLDTITNVVLWLCLATLPSMIVYAGGRWLLRRALSP